MWKLISFGVTLVLGGIASWLYFSSEPKRELNAVTRELSVRVCRDFSERLPRLVDMEDVLLVPVVGGRDEDNRLRELFIEQISASRKYSFHSWDRIKAKLEGGNLWQIFVKKVGLVGEDPPKSLDEAAKAAKELASANYKIDGILIVKGLIDEAASNDGLGARVTLTGHFYDAKKRQPLTDVEITAEERIDSIWNRLYLTHKIDRMGAITRFVVWFLIGSLLPWGLLPVLRKILRAKDNTKSAAALALMTLVDVFAAWIFLMAVTEMSLGGLLFLSVIAGLSGYYNYDALDYIDRRLL